MTSSTRALAAALTGLATLTASLSLTTLGTPAQAAPATDLVISEYVEGTGNNKALEIWNGTGAPVDLSGYQLRVAFNGAATANLTIDLTGQVAAGDVHVVAASGAVAAVTGAADQTTGAGLWNGDDAIALVRGGAVVDSFGQRGVDPGAEWGSGPVSTQDATLRRLPSVCEGDRTDDDAFDPARQWQGLPVDTFDGLGSHTADCGGDPGTPAAVVLNEFSASTAGTDVEYLEVTGPAGADLTGLTVLQVEGDATSSAQGDVVSAHPVGSADADGRWLGELPANTLQNGSLSLLLVTGYTGQVTLDADLDGTLDEGLGLEVVDSVAVLDGGAGDLGYGPTVLTPGYDGSDFTVGGASRIPDGTDTDATSDWVRNDFDLAGVPGQQGSLTAGEALNTPGAENRTTPAGPGPGEPLVCGDPRTAVGAVQGTTDTSPLAGTSTTVEGTVVGDFQTGGFDGFYLQDAGDGDEASSDGIFVYAPGAGDVALGDTVRVAGAVSEFRGQTQLTATDQEVCASGGELPTAEQLTLPLDDAEAERHEGMRVTFGQSLTILEYFDYGRYGEIALGLDRQYQPTALFAPGSPEAEALLAKNLAERITLDDGRSVQNPDPARHPDGGEFTLENTFRGGDLVTDATGVLDWRFDEWRIQPTEGAEVTSTNPRPEVPEVGGTTTVASFNVLNYFTTLGERGADTPEEFERQEAKIVAALSEMDADVVGLIEIENNGGQAVDTLVEALNAEVGAGTYESVDTGVIGTDQITTAFIYQPAEVTPTGGFATLTTADDPRFLDQLNRPALAQTFTDLGTGGAVTVAVNHLKSKGSGCEAVGDPEDPDGQGNCNGVRTEAAKALSDWLADDPTGTGVEEQLIIGDLNSYDHEDPITALEEAGWTDLLLRDQGERAYSYVFDGMLGYLDYALANEALVDQVTEAEDWRINSDEPSLLDYDTSFKAPAQDAVFAPDPYRSSDHDPVLVGMDLQADDVTAPELRLTASPARIWPPNNKAVLVEVDVEAVDDSGEEVTVELVSAEAEGRRANVKTYDDERTFRVVAAKDAVYTFTYRATDGAGNSTTESVTVEVTQR
ncbi:ExeM/NucH family extracellular endonuclease [Auraticoccus monumenti]|uniref:LTD domain-containing protein n=1 Tax=Auraticoccus monumenti TaxID=675864 RepID=A0A1G6S3I3_9ACTN|nr:ExeM/NucH family extracellular endonuclease [Auraticoccus monumenti]SDD10746.1 hypothetical protein SAMN04489747_0192 [Auraticoccus monumenti]